MGLFLWTLGCFGSGMATGYSTLLGFRVLTGVGSAAIVTLATPFIDDISPRSAKTLWFGMLYLVGLLLILLNKQVRQSAPGFGDVGMTDGLEPFLPWPFVQLI